LVQVCDHGFGGTGKLCILAKFSRTRKNTKKQKKWNQDQITEVKAKVFYFFVVCSREFGVNSPLSKTKTPTNPKQPLWERGGTQVTTQLAGISVLKLKI
jgi:hypothetical protein